MQVAVSSAFRGDYIAFYSLEVSRELSDLVELVSHKLNLPVVILGKGGRFILRCRTKMAIGSGPAEFLGWLMNASFVITNSFHATAFSILLQKPFFTVPHSTRKARMESLLHLTGLLGRQIDGLDKVADLSAEEMLKIDYTHTENELRREIKKSMDFLDGALS
jgi:exopolysaccharide biosynthesis predicted pyruvyltransferase EpsI